MSAAALASVQGALALDLGALAPATHPLLDPPPRPRAVRPLADGTEQRTTGHPDVVEVPPARRARLESWAHRYLQAATEIAGGDRPATQLARWTDARVHQDLTRRGQVVARAGLRTAGDRPGRRSPAVRPQVLGVHSCFVDDAVVEVCARVRYGERSRAVAARFREVQGTWRCTALEFA